MDGNLSPEQAKEMLLKGALSVIDVRTPKEYAEGHIDGARNINIGSPDFENEITKLDKSKPYLVYCRSGGRSSKAQAMMRELGFGSIYNLSGGFSQWGTN